MATTQVNIHNLDELRRWIKDFSSHLPERAVLLLSGPMGAGKTQMVRFLAEILNAKEVASPSFAIHHQYQTDRGGMDHLDLFRLEDEDDLESTGFWDLFSRPQGLIVIEWADRLDTKWLPHNWNVIAIQIENLGGSQRRLTITQ